MKRMLTLLIPCTLLLLGPSAQGALVTATAELDYAQEVNPSNAIPSTATGSATLVFDTVSGLLSLSAEIAGISLADVTFPAGGLSFAGVGPFHIHMAPAGANGPIVVPFNSPSFFSDTATGLSISATDVAFDQSILTPLLAGDLYLNLHTLDYGSGEIRGQLAVPEPSVVGLLGTSLLAFVFVRLRRR